jgi:hypothetical protein
MFGDAESQRGLPCRVLILGSVEFSTSDHSSMMNQAHDSPRSESSSPLSPHFQDCCTGSDDEGLQNFIHGWLSGITNSETPAPSVTSEQPVSSHRVAKSPSLQPVDSSFLPTVCIRLATEARRPFDPSVRRFSSVRCGPFHRKHIFDQFQSQRSETTIDDPEHELQLVLNTEVQLFHERNLAQHQFQQDWSRLQTSWERLKASSCKLHLVQQKSHSMLSLTHVSALSPPPPLPFRRHSGPSNPNFPLIENSDLSRCELSGRSSGRSDMSLDSRVGLGGALQPCYSSL